MAIGIFGYCNTVSNLLASVVGYPNFAAIHLETYTRSFKCSLECVVGTGQSYRLSLPDPVYKIGHGTPLKDGADAASSHARTYVSYRENQKLGIPEVGNSENINRLPGHLGRTVNFSPSRTETCQSASGHLTKFGVRVLASVDIQISIVVNLN